LSRARGRGRAGDDLHDRPPGLGLGCDLQARNAERAAAGCRIARHSALPLASAATTGVVPGARQRARAGSPSLRPGAHPFALLAAAVVRVPARGATPGAVRGLAARVARSLPPPTRPGAE